MNTRAILAVLAAILILIAPIGCDIMPGQTNSPAAYMQPDYLSNNYNNNNLRKTPGVVVCLNLNGGALS
jgi:hypothetical protein